MPIQYTTRLEDSDRFDYLGFLTPFTLTAKIIIQDLWRLKIGWDNEVDDKVNKVKWKQWLEDLSLISSSIRIPRNLNIQPLQIL